MKVKELREALSQFPGDMEVLTKKTEIFGNVAYVNSVRKDTYGCFGHDEHCVLLTDEFEGESEEK